MLPLLSFLCHLSWKCIGFLVFAQLDLVTVTICDSIPLNPGKLGQVGAKGEVHGLAGLAAQARYVSLLEASAAEGHVSAHVFDSTLAPTRGDEDESKAAQKMIEYLLRTI